jgi:hypothetical protein
VRLLWRLPVSREEEFAKSLESKVKLTRWPSIRRSLMRGASKLEQANLSKHPMPYDTG